MEQQRELMDLAGESAEGAAGIALALAQARGRGRRLLPPDRSPLATCAALTAACVSSSRARRTLSRARWLAVACICARVLLDRWC